MEKTISVNGSGSIHVVPDVTRLEVTVESVFENYEKAYARAQENSKWLGQVLEYNKLSAKQAKTIYFDISDHLVDEYDDEDHYIGHSKAGYDLKQRFKIDLGMDTVLLNKIVRGVGKFVRDAQINIGYTIRDPRPHQLKMIERAVLDATEKAGIMAKAAGCELGDVSEISYGESHIDVYSQARSIHSNNEAMACNTNSLDITPDDLVMSDSVHVSWVLHKKD